MDIIPVFNQMIVLFLLLAAGYIAGKAGIMTTDACKILTKIILNITLPCLVVASVSSAGSGVSGTDVLTMFILGFAVYIIFAIWAFIIPKILRVPADKVGVYRFMSMFSNSSYMGFPVVTAILGAEALFYASVYNIPFNIMAFSLGVYFITGKASFSPRLLLTPAIIASIGAVVLFFSGLTLPTTIQSALSTMGSVTTPASMLVIGGTLAAMPLKEILSDWRIYIFAVFRLILIPLSVWAILNPIIANRTILGIAVIIAAMPAAVNTTMLCTQYGRDSSLASRGVFITTALSVFTIPLVAWLLF